MTPLLALVLVVSVFCGILALLGYLFEKKHKPIEKFEQRWPTTKGWER